jgi:hypothetical protein
MRLHGHQIRKFGLSGHLSGASGSLPPPRPPSRLTIRLLPLMITGDGFDLRLQSFILHGEAAGQRLMRRFATILLVVARLVFFGLLAGRRCRPRFIGRPLASCVRRYIAIFGQIVVVLAVIVVVDVVVVVVIIIASLWEIVPIRVPIVGFDARTPNIIVGIPLTCRRGSRATWRPRPAAAPRRRRGGAPTAPGSFLGLHGKARPRCRRPGSLASRRMTPCYHERQHLSRVLALAAFRRGYTAGTGPN